MTTRYVSMPGLRSTASTTPADRTHRTPRRRDVRPPRRSSESLAGHGIRRRPGSESGYWLEEAGGRVRFREASEDAAHRGAILGADRVCWWRPTTGPIRPGGKIGTMRLARGIAAGADAKLFDFCDPIITQPGR